MSRPRHLVVMGVSGTGKSSVGSRVAERLSMRYVEGDSFHPRANVEKMSQGIPLDDDDRKPWLEALAQLTAEADAQGRDTVVTCSALKRVYRDLLRLGVPPGRTYFVHLHAEKEVLQQRMETREHFMPASLLQSQLDTLQPLGADEDGITVDVAAPLAQVVDDVVAAVAAYRWR